MKFSSVRECVCVCWFTSLVARANNQTQVKATLSAPGTVAHGDLPGGRGAVPRFSRQVATRPKMKTSGKLENE